MGSGRFVGTNEFIDQADVLVHNIGSSGETCYITEGGRAKAVLLDINTYNALMDVVEDAECPKESEINPIFRECISVRGILHQSNDKIKRKHR
jgi:PHD/YefM family antitoxin component YafN of YafNO toxin-antitoxin module